MRDRYASEVRKRGPAAAFIVAVVLFAIVNVFLSLLFPATSQKLDRNLLSKLPEEERQQGTWSFWIARSFLSSEKPPDAILFGSSLVGSATFSADALAVKNYRDCVLDRRAVSLEQILTRTLAPSAGASRAMRPEVFNASVPGSMASDAYMMGRALISVDHKPQLVIVGINPRDFIDNTLSAPSETDPFNFFSSYVSLDRLSRFAFADPFAYLDWVADHYLPLKRVHRKAIEWAGGLEGKNDRAATSLAAASDGQKRSLLQTILGGTAEVKKGEWLIPYPMPYGFIDNTAEYLRRYKNPYPPIYRAEKEFFTAFLKDMQEKKVKVLVVNMPSTSPNRSLLPAAFWSDFKAYLAGECRATGAFLVDLSDDQRFTTNDYLDTVHLNGGGGIKLFHAIAQAISGEKELAQSFIPGSQTADTRGLVRTTSVDNAWR